MKKVNIIFLSKSEFGNAIPNITDFKMIEIPKIGESITFNSNILKDSNEESLNVKPYTVKTVEHYIYSKDKNWINIYVK